MMAAPAHVAVIGLGYVGLPLAVEAARAGMQVIGIDTDQRVVNGLEAGRSHVDDVSDADVQAARSSSFVATTDAVAVSEVDVVVVCVPTPLSPNGGPDLSAVESAARAIAGHLKRDTLVVLESTTYPGTTDEIFVPILQRSGLTAGADFQVAFSPERVDPGNPTYGIKNTPKVVGGYTPRCTEAALAFYRRFIDTVVPAKGTREAEMSKLLENTYRHINIALVNEMARFSHEMGIDLWDVIDCAATKPFGFEAFRPGPGVGGHCIPIDPSYLSHTVQAQLRYPFRFVELATEINASMPGYVARRVQDLLNDEGRALRGAHILILGTTYKPDIADERESPAVPLARRLRGMGAVISFHDPYVPVWTLGGEKPLDRVPNLDTALREADISVLLQHHRAYDPDHLSTTARLLFDTRGVTHADGIARL
ncbi:MAG: UDP-N-acetyl-D-glucosamine dehydrogenase [Kribbellaceae bacterium]|nr:UDP-N-acetyl-D-glucosamine dehydrogenase [Kribbellaceae bacterium]